MMHIGQKIAVICLESIDNEKEKINLVNSLKSTKKIILETGDKVVMVSQAPLNLSATVSYLEV